VNLAGKWISTLKYGENRMQDTRNRIERIAISKLSTFTFCEYRFYLEEVMGYRARPTNAMYQGTKAHAMLVNNHQH
jgi:CRISPR/Cas system-associated exonuclease Cas4 (RecB family)